MKIAFCPKKPRMKDQPLIHLQYPKNKDKKDAEGNYIKQKVKTVRLPVRQLIEVEDSTAKTILAKYDGIVLTEEEFKKEPKAKKAVI